MRVHIFYTTLRREGEVKTILKKYFFFMNLFFKKRLNLLYFFKRDIKLNLKIIPINYINGASYSLHLSR